MPCLRNSGRVAIWNSSASSAATLPSANPAAAPPRSSVTRIFSGLLSSDSSVSAVQLPWKHSCSIAFICTNRLSVGFIPASALLCVGGERYGKLYCALHFLGEYLRCLVRLRLRSLNDQLIMHL